MYVRAYAASEGKRVQSQRSTGASAAEKKGEERSGKGRGGLSSISTSRTIQLQAYTPLQFLEALTYNGLLRIVAPFNDTSVPRARHELRLCRMP